MSTDESAYSRAVRSTVNTALNTANRRTNYTALETTIE
jgi:hypothetical protein